MFLLPSVSEQHRRVAVKANDFFKREYTRSVIVQRVAAACELTGSCRLRSLSRTFSEAQAYGSVTIPNSRPYIPRS